jgi:hypothetical protein
VAKILVPALVAAALVWPAPAAHAAPADPYPAAVACQTALGEIGAGDLAQAKAILTALPAPAEDPCVVQALIQLDERRATAAAEVLAGQTRLRAGDLPAARAQFLLARATDTGNQDAVAGLAQVTGLADRALPTASSNWSHFYDDWLSPIGRLLLPAAVGILVLLLASSLVARLLVRPASVAWPRPQRYLLSIVGALLIVGASVLFPTYPMFQPFRPGNPLLWSALGLVLAVMALVAGTVAWAARFLAGQGLVVATVWKDWGRLLTAVGAVPAAGAVLWFTCLTQLDSHLLLVYLALTLFGVILSAAGLGQNLRLQIEAQDQTGNADAAATDYLLARLVTLGTEDPKGLAVTMRQTTFSALQSEDLSALPAGTVVSTLARVFYTLRPDLTWRARVTTVDCNRISVTLTRNGRRADSAIFSRPDLALPPLDGSPTAEARARAQLLTGAAAFILVHLSQVHRELLGGLSGARNWKSVTLRVIAASRSLIDVPAQQAELLATAVDEDPGNLAARFDYLWAAFQQVPAAERDHADFAQAVHYCMSGSPQAVALLAKTPQLRIRVLYTLASQRLNGYLESDRTDNWGLSAAAHAAYALRRACRPQPTASREHAWLAAQMLPFAENLVHATDVLFGQPAEPRHWRHHPHNAAFYSPRLSWDHACLDSFLRVITDEEEWTAKAVQDLQFALPTESARRMAQQDPCFRPLLHDSGFRRLVGLPLPTLLDLPQFAGAKAALEGRGLTDPGALAAATTDLTARMRLATQLGVAVDTVADWHRLADLATLQPALGDPELLKLLDGLGIRSRRELISRTRQDRRALVRALRAAAAAGGLARLPGVVNPLPWLDAAEQASV